MTGASESFIAHLIECHTFAAFSVRLAAGVHLPFSVGI